MKVIERIPGKPGILVFLHSKNCYNICNSYGRCMIMKTIRKLSRNIGLYIIISLLLKTLLISWEITKGNLVYILISLIFSIPSIMMLISVSLLFKHKKGTRYLVIINMLISLMFFSDMLYYRAFGHLLTIHVGLPRMNAGGMSEGIISLVKLRDMLFFADLPLFLLILKSGFFRTELKIRKERAIIFILCFVVGASSFIAQVNKIEDSHLSGNFEKLPIFLSPLGNHFYDIYGYYYEKKWSLSDEEKIEISEWIHENRKFNDASTEFQNLKGIFSDKNIIAIQFESLESSLIGLEVNGIEVTPNINRLLDNSIYFPNILEQVGDGNSSDAELMFNTSLYPLNKGSAFVRFGNNSYNSLPKILGEQGYTSVAIHGDDKAFWNRDIVFNAMGYSEYIDESKFPDKEYEGMGILDEYLFSLSAENIQKLESPYFYYMITITSHMPFYLSAEKNSLSFGQEGTFEDYLKSINYTDKHFGKFLDELESDGELDNAVIVLFGDHEGVSKYYDTANYSNDRKIPVIFYSKSISGQTIEKIGGQVDIMPSLLYLLGLDQNEEYYTMGRNLLSNYSGSGILNNGTVVDGMDYPGLLIDARRISDLIIKSNTHMEYSE